MPAIDLEFAHEYEVEEFRELPGTGKLGIPLIYFPQPKTRPEHDGLWVTIHPTDGRSWTGVFQGLDTSCAISRVVSTPDPERVCVVSGGLGYLVKANQPEIWEEIVVAPITDVRSLSEQALIVFADFTNLAAYTRNGLAWKTQPLCWDELKILRITASTLEGVGYEAEFAVDIRTGRSLLPLRVPGS